MKHTQEGVRKCLVPALGFIIKPDSSTLNPLSTILTLFLSPSSRTVLELGERKGLGKVEKFSTMTEEEQLALALLMQASGQDGPTQAMHGNVILRLHFTYQSSLWFHKQLVRPGKQWPAAVEAAWGNNEGRN